MTTERIALLTTGEARQRARSAVFLADEYSQEATVALLSALCTESDSQVWAVILESVIPLRIIELDKILLELQYWPFSPVRSFALTKRIAGYRLRRVDQEVRQWIVNGDPIMRLSALQYLANTGTRADLSLIADDLHIDPSEVLHRASEFVPGTGELRDQVRLVKLIAKIMPR